MGETWVGNPLPSLRPAWASKLPAVLRGLQPHLCSTDMLQKQTMELLLLGIASESPHAQVTAALAKLAPDGSVAHAALQQEAEGD